LRAKTLLKMAENLNAELIRRGDNLLEMWKKEVAENCDRIRENQTLKTERDQLLAKVDQLENDELPRCKDALLRANSIGAEMDEENRQLRHENEKLKRALRELAATRNAAEVKRGGWVQDVYDMAMDMITCSRCQQKWNILDNDTHTFIYCPNCGAKMEVGSDEQAT
jgi:predicted RNA-binding Zn-ribbon protein involved in translation (DUF1610 family)